jgi:hypothetical protein
MFFLEIAKLGYLNKLNVKDVNEILGNNKGYFKEIFDMYNYIMLVMAAIEQDRSAAQNKKPYQNNIPQDLYKEIMGDVSNIAKQERAEKITIEVTAEDMERMKAERKKNRPNLK